MGSRQFEGWCTWNLVLKWLWWNCVLITHKHISYVLFMCHHKYIHCLDAGVFTNCSWLIWTVQVWTGDFFIWHSRQSPGVINDECINTDTGHFPCRALVLCLPRHLQYTEPLLMLLVTPVPVLLRSQHVCCDFAHITCDAAVLIWPWHGGWWPCIVLKHNST